MEQAYRARSNGPTPRGRSRASQSKILVSPEEDELNQVLAENTSISSRTDKVLYQVIQPSVLCQMGCYYCGQDHKEKLISPQHMLKIVNSIQNMVLENDYEKLYIGWFGAEPLTAIKQMRTIGGLLTDLCREKGIVFGSKIITNGLNLVPRYYDLLVRELNIDFFEITLDGPELVHDRQRDLKSGGGTFKRIYANIKKLLSYRKKMGIKFTVSIQCNVDQNNYKAVLDLIDQLKKDGLLNLVNFYATGIYSWGANANTQKLEKTHFAELEPRWLEQLYRAGVNVRKALLPGRVHNTCLATKANSRVYDADGNIFTCTEVPYTKNQTVSPYFAGNLSDDGLSFRPHTFWIDALKGKTQYPCSDCPMLPVCGGGCPKQWEEGEVPCPTFKFNAEEKLRMYYQYYAQINQ
jgi:uncharacterized protein